MLRTALSDWLYVTEIQTSEILNYERRNGQFGESGTSENAVILMSFKELRHCLLSNKGFSYCHSCHAGHCTSPIC